MPIGPFLTQGEPYDITYYGPPILWADGGVPAGKLSAGLTSGTYYAYYDTWSAEKSVTHQDKSWEFDWEWRRLSTTNLWVKELATWRETNDEVVGDATDSQDDVDVPLLIHPRNAASLTGQPNWDGLITISHEGELPVCAPVGISRPANWTGGAGMTPQSPTGASNDSWDIVAGSAAATATFVLPSRYWTRMIRLADHTAVEDKHSTFFPWLNRPNLDTWASVTLDDTPDQIDEVEWHWRNHSHLEIRFTTAPRNATISVTVNYSYPSNITDPNYTCFEHRYGTSGTFDYTKTTKSVTYSFDVTAGSGVLGTVDLKVPLTGDVCPELHVVDSVVLTFDASVGDETWVLDDLYLVLDKTAGIPDDHETVRMYDVYDWLSDYTGFGGLIDGVPVFDIRYGFEELEGTERSLKIRQMRRHCPSSGLGDILDYAKTIAELRRDIYFQRGWGAVDNDPAESAENKDGDGNKVLGTFRAFDLRECNEWRFDGAMDLIGQPRVKTYQLVAGVEHDIYHVKFPQGRLHLLHYEDDRSGRLRSTSGIYVWRSDAGVWSLIQGPLTTDGYGRVRTGPHKERDYSEDTDWVYGISTSAVETPGPYSVIDNRRYGWKIIPPPSTGEGLCVFDQLPNFAYIFYTEEDEDGIKHIYNAPPDRYFETGNTQAHYSLPRTDTTDEDTSPTGYVDGNGKISLFVVRSSAVTRLTSSDWGLNWGAAVATAITSADKFRVRRSRDGSAQIAAYINGGTFTYAASHDHFTTVDEDATIASGVDDSQCDIYHGSDGNLYAYGAVDGLLTCWKSTTRGRTWTEVGTV